MRSKSCQYPGPSAPMPICMEGLDEAELVFGRGVVGVDISLLSTSCAIAGGGVAGLTGVVAVSAGCIRLSLTSATAGPSERGSDSTLLRMLSTRTEIGSILGDGALDVLLLTHALLMLRLVGFVSP